MRAIEALSVGFSLLVASLLYDGLPAPRSEQLATTVDLFASVPGAPPGSRPATLRPGPQRVGGVAAPWPPLVPAARRNQRDRPGVGTAAPPAAPVWCVLRALVVGGQSGLLAHLYIGLVMLATSARPAGAPAIVRSVACATSPVFGWCARKESNPWPLAPSTPEASALPAELQARISFP
jgi:hypothetical protein